MEKITEILYKNAEIIPVLLLLGVPLYLLIRKQINGLGGRLSKEIDTIKNNHFKHVENDHNNISGKLDTIIEELKSGRTNRI